MIGPTRLFESVFICVCVYVCVCYLIYSNYRRFMTDRTYKSIVRFELDI